MKFCLRQKLAKVVAEGSRFVRDVRAIGAVEFALIVPLMLVMFFGTIEISSGVAIDRKVTLVTQTVSDLVSRYKSVTNTDITNLFAIADAMLTPYATSDLSATVTELYINPANGKACVQWSKGDAIHTPGEALTVPDALIARDSAKNVAANQYLIFSEVSYTYKPTVAWLLAKDGIVLKDKTYTRPRLSTCVLLNPASSSTTCTSPAPTTC